MRGGIVLGGRARGVRFLRVRPSGHVTARRREVELSVERPVGPAGPPGGVARIATRFEVDPGGEGPSPAELRTAFDRLSADLDALVGPLLAAAPAARTDRELTELIETYRPRQKELVDLLRDDGEISPAEHERLAAYLDSGGGPESPARRAEVPVDRPLAAVPIGSDRSLPPSRPIPELLRTFQIATLRQAGLVRLRRQISFAEYMALKRHFEEGEGSARSSSKGGAD